MSYRVMEVREDGEKFCVEEFRTESEANKWLSDNRENYFDSFLYITQPRSFFSDYLYGG